MPDRRIILALPILLALPAYAAAQPTDTATDAALVEALLAGWLARGVRFSAETISARIGARRGKPALVAVGGAATSTDGEEWEIAVEILWENGQPPSPAAPFIAADLANGLPLLLIDQGGQPWLLHALTDGKAQVTRPARGDQAALPLAAAALIARPVIAGA